MNAISVAALPGGWIDVVDTPANGDTLTVNLQTGELALESASTVIENIVYLPVQDTTDVFVDGCLPGYDIQNQYCVT